MCVKLWRGAVDQIFVRQKTINKELYSLFAVCNREKCFKSVCTMLCSPIQSSGSEVDLLFLACIVTCILFTYILHLMCWRGFLVGCLLAFGFVLNFILSFQATERNKQKKGEKKPANTLFNLNGANDTVRCRNCVLSCSLKCCIAHGS